MAATKKRSDGGNAFAESSHCFSLVCRSSHVNQGEEDLTSLLVVLEKGRGDLVLHDTAADSGYVPSTVDGRGIELSHVDLDALLHLLQSRRPAMGACDC